MRVTERRTAIGEDWLLAMTIPRRPTLLLLSPPLIPRDVGHQACPSSTMIPLAVTRSRPRHSPARRARRNESPACYGSVGRKQARLSFSVRRQEEERGGYGWYGASAPTVVLFALPQNNNLRVDFPVTRDSNLALHKVDLIRSSILTDQCRRCSPPSSSYFSFLHLP
jgi:hypothetical protein